MPYHNQVLTPVGSPKPQALEADVPATTFTSADSTQAVDKAVAASGEVARVQASGKAVAVAAANAAVMAEFNGAPSSRSVSAASLAGDGGIPVLAMDGFKFADSLGPLGASSSSVDAPGSTNASMGSVVAGTRSPAPVTVPPLAPHLMTLSLTGMGLTTALVQVQEGLDRQYSQPCRSPS